MKTTLRFNPPPTTGVVFPVYSPRAPAPSPNSVDFVRRRRRRNEDQSFRRVFVFSRACARKPGSEYISAKRKKRTRRGEWFFFVSILPAVASSPAPRLRGRSQLLLPVGISERIRNAFAIENDSYFFFPKRLSPPRVIRFRSILILGSPCAARTNNRY